MDAPIDTFSVTLFAGLERDSHEGRTALEVAPGDAPTVAALTAFLGLGPGVAGLVLVNGLHAAAEQRLHGGDEVALFPPLGGG